MATRALACFAESVLSMSTTTLSALVSTSPISTPPSWWNITRLPERIAIILSREGGREGGKDGERVEGREGGGEIVWKGKVGNGLTIHKIRMNKHP